MRSLAVFAAMLSLFLPRLGFASGTPVTAKPVSTTKPAAKATAHSASPSRSDADIEKDIRARFAKSKIGVEKYQVHVQGGVATIEGKPDVIQHKGVATRLAKSGGASAVSNHIEISEAAKEKAAENLASGRRRAQVKRGDARSDSRSQTATAVKK